MSAETAAGSDRWAGAGYYRHRAPDHTEKGTAVSVRINLGGAPVYLKVGPANRGFSLDRAEAWALWACLGAGLGASGDQPEWLSTQIEPS